MRRLVSYVLLPSLCLLATVAGASSQDADPDPDRGLPLEPERWARFTTSEGTWISLDVSPDGQTLVFDLLGDLYTMPVTGGTATRLTDGLPHDMQPRFSPDGEQLVFVSDRSGDDNVWVMPAAGGEPRQVTKGIGSAYLSPEWAPEGDYIVVSRQAPLAGLDKIWLYHVDGGTGLEMVTGPPAQRMMGAAFGPDPRYVWYAQRTGSWSYNAILPQYQLRVYDRETGTITPMTARYGSAFRPALSPDGTLLAYGSRHDADTGIRLRDLASGEERWLAYPVQRDEQESVANMDVLPGYTFTPDSEALILSYGGGIWRVPVDGSDPTEIPFTVQAEVAIGPEVSFQYPIEDTPTFTVKQIRDAVPSPDGSRIAFTALDRLYVSDLDGGEPRRLTSQNVGEYHPTWSPDGSAIAFVTWDDEAAQGRIMRVAAGGGTPTTLTDAPAFYQQTAWSPDGARIVAIRTAAQFASEATVPFGYNLDSEFVWVPASGGAVTVIGPTRNRQGPHFVADDPDRIYLYGTAPGVEVPGSPQSTPPTVALQSIRWDDTDPRQHLRVTRKFPVTAGSWRMEEGSDIVLPREYPEDAEEPSIPALSAGFVMMAPRGDQALANINGDIYVVTVPMVGARVPTVDVTDPDSASLPMRKLSDIGGEFPTWSADGRTIHWSLGNAFVSYDLDAAGGDPGYLPTEQRIEVQADRDIPQGTVVLRGGRIVTMNGDRVIQSGDVVVTNNRITSVTEGRADVPAGATVIDVTGKTVVPGFVDTHAHMRPLWGLHWSRPWPYLANLAYGVTTTRDPQTATTDVLTYEDRIRAGQMPGPRIYSTGPGVFFLHGIESLDHARSVLSRYSEYYDTKTFKMYMTGNRRQRQWLIMAARELGLMPTTEGGLDYRLDMTHAMDGYAGVEHNLSIIPAYHDVVELFATSGTVNTPTLLVTYGGPWAENYYYTNEDVVGDAKLAHFTPQPDLDAKIRRRNPGPGPGGWFHEEEYAFRKHAAWLDELVAGGGKTGVGSHGQLQGLGWHWELWLVASGGMSNHDALRVATIMGAEALGLGGDLGSVEPGKLADLVILNGNPLDDIRNSNTVDQVMMNGRLYDGDTLDQVWPRAVPAADERWRHVAPDADAGVRGGAR